MTYANYEPYTRPSRAEEEQHRRADWAQCWAVEQVIGDNVELTTETLCQFLPDLDEERQPLLTQSDWLRGPIGSSQLLQLMFNRRNTDHVIAAATRELAARYLSCDYTKRVIQDEFERAMR